TSVELTEGDATVLTATVNPSNASNKNVYWTSSDQSVATVDNAGQVTALKAGSATITVTTEDGGKTSTCQVTVKEKIYPVTGVTLDRTSVELTEGDATVLTATVNPSNASNKNVYWTSSDQSVATVDNTGKVIAVKAGSATITVTTEDGGKTSTCQVTVKKPSHGVDIGDWEDDGSDDGGIAS
ncbi:MAG: Ig domain-containing protein, partial [Bacteroidales bacterium]|nr:Ig domain-containing protein [Bacteroidales bacterium]